MCPLVLSLYGHTDSGGYWEEDCDAATKSCGWLALLLIYVDDFKMAAPNGVASGMWADLKKLISMEEP